VKENSIIVRSLSMVSQFTIHMLVPIGMCSYGGYWLDKKLGTSFLFVIFFFIGALAGGRNIFLLVEKISESKDKKPSTLYGSNQKRKSKKGSQ